MPILPNFLENMLFFNLNQAPGPVLEIFSAAAFRIVLAAVRLDVFNALERGPATAGELAERVQASQRGTGLLLSSLEAFGYVTSREGIFTNTAMTQKWLLDSSAANISAGFEYWGTILAELWGDLETTIRNGHPAANLYEWIEAQPQASAAFQAWMVGLAQLMADELLGKIRFPSHAKRLLDVGGGHGQYSIALCRKYPALAATIFDSPQALHAARANIAAAHMEDRIRVQEGDFLKDSLGSGYDAVLLLNILHGFSSEQNQELARKAASALNTGGMVVIAEQVASRSSGRAAKSVVRVLEMSYFQLLDGQVYTYAQIAGWLQAAGFTRQRRTNLLKAPGNCLITGWLSS